LKSPQGATIGAVGTMLGYLLVAVVVAAVVFLVASLVFGRGEELPALPADASPTWLPEGPLTGDDVRAVRFSQVLRGYRMSEVDWTLRRAAAELDALRARVAELEAREPMPGQAQEQTQEQAQEQTQEQTRKWARG
jgi:DivIVA domain-containing protein